MMVRITTVVGMTTCYGQAVSMHGELKCKTYFKHTVRGYNSDFRSL